MPLQFADFIEDYEKSGIPRERWTEHFAAFTDFIQLVARTLCKGGSVSDALGISLDFDRNATADPVESKDRLTPHFEKHAAGKAGRSGP